jgi:alpha-beta hydrolase superfamily lysophospholipase
MLPIAVTLMLLSATETQPTITMRGKSQTVRVSGSPGGTPVIVSSGDGGWIHLAPHIAETLAAHGFFVIGFDARAYLSSFTERSSTLRVEDVAGDYKALIAFAAQRSAQKPLLIGVSEGAGLSVLAATDGGNKARIEGVIGLGLSDKTELGWRWRDMVIYLTHATPDEPTFSVEAIAGAVSPVPLAAIHSAHDEYVALTEVQQVMARAREPKRLWVIDAANHRFSDKLPEFDGVLLDAVSWIRRERARTP